MAGPLGFREVAGVPVSLLAVIVLAVIVDCHDPRRQAEWWAQVPAYQVNLATTS